MSRNDDQTPALTTWQVAVAARGVLGILLAMLCGGAAFVAFFTGEADSAFAFAVVAFLLWAVSR